VLEIRVFRARSQDNYLASSRTFASCETNSIHINNIILWPALIFGIFLQPGSQLHPVPCHPAIQSLAHNFGNSNWRRQHSRRITKNTRPRRTFHFSYQQFSARLVEFCLNVFTIDYTRVRKTRRNCRGKMPRGGQCHCQAPK